MYGVESSASCVVSVNGPPGVERLNSHEERPLLLGCDFSSVGIRELCTLQSSSSENIGNTKLLWTVPARL